MPLLKSTMIGTDTSQETEYSLPGSPDLRQIAHNSLGDWLHFRPTLRPRYWQGWRELFLSVLVLARGHIAPLPVTVRIGNAIGLAIGGGVSARVGFLLKPVLCFGHSI